MTALPALLDPLAAEPDRAALLVDYDGTLAPIVDDPARAVPRPDAVAALRALAPVLGLVAVVSGRPVDVLRRGLGTGLDLVGHYGLERLVGDAVVVDPRAEASRPAIAAAADEASRHWPDLVVERKGGLGVTLHWRSRSERAPDPAEVAALAARHGLRLAPGRMACELRPSLPVDKGTAVAELIAAPIRAAAFVGDDRSDLAAFDALDDLERAGTLDVARRVAVASEEAPPELLARAELVVDGPDGVARLLDALVRAISERQPR